MDVTNSISINYGSGILREAIKIMACPRSEATHFAICHGSHIKFLVQLKSGVSFLQRAAAPYNKKLLLLLRLFPYIPKYVLQAAGLGYFTRISIHPEVQSVLPQTCECNILVGTYDSAQKLVFQCFTNKNTACTFIKVGNHGSAEQMENEIQFLKESKPYQSFQIPHLNDYALISEGASFNIQITDEFEGEKIPPILNEEIYRMTTEIAGEPTAINGELYTFSHGDFAPWNIRKNGGRYTVFDWEHYGLRPVGYDAAYFIIMSEVALHKSNFNKAFDKACQQIQQFAPELKLNRELILQEFSRTTKALIF